jgi:hypothetical protein
MHESTSAPFAHPSPPGTPSEAETLARQAFQAVHPEVGFAFRAGAEPPWVAYWLAAGDERRYVTGATMSDVLGRLAQEFG